MLISKKMSQAINEQIGNEFNAQLQYVAIASHFDRESLPQLASFFYKQADEERQHGMKFVKYLVDTDATVHIPQIPAPKADFNKAEEAVQHSLDHEKKVTEQINNLVALAVEEKDYTTQTFLNWFVSEQLEEVSTMEGLLRVVQRAGEENLLYVETYLAGHNSTHSPQGQQP